MENQKPDYYSSKKRMIIDLAIGFVGLPALVMCFVWLQGVSDSVAAGLITFIISLCVLVLLVAFAKKRRFIWLGAASFVAFIVLLMFGACFITPFMR